MPTDTTSRADSLLEQLSAAEIDISSLRATCIWGIPEEFRLRGTCWRILLGYLPLKRSLWSDHLQRSRDTYQTIVNDMLLKPSSPNNSCIEDHPLSTNPTSTWSNYFKDNEILMQIDKDVRRLCPEISFFQQPTTMPHPRLASDPLCRRVHRTLLDSEVHSKDRSGANVVTRKCANEEYQLLPAGQEAHWQVVERILFLYSKLNPGVSYVQGMNELLGPIYYVFASDLNKQWQEYAEADAFWCFQNLMATVKDNFIRKLDDSNCGIESMMSQFYALIEKKDPDLHRLLVEEQELLPQYYAFRWLSLLLSQEFLLPDVIRIWDSLFSDAQRFDFLSYVCLAMLILVRDQLFANDFTSNMKLLQNYPASVDVAQIIILAIRLRDE